MSKKIVEEVEKEIRKKLNNDNVKWSSDVDLELIEDKRTVVIAITDANYKENMQKDVVCFEGWALALKTYFLDGDYDIVELKCDNILVPAKGKLNKDFGKRFDHSNRFLYRALRFSEQYKDWFRLEASLKEKVEQFKKYLEEHKGELLNNVPEPEKKSDKKNSKDELNEAAVERFIVENKEKLPLLLGIEKSVFDKENDRLIVNRQLPVGLSERGQKIFPGGAAAIDLWAYYTLRKNEFYIFELKFQKKMLGIISEIFFYANYMYDLLTKKGSFTLNNSGKKNFRGYEMLRKCKQENIIDTINAVMLADKGNLHPVITKELLETLNAKDRGVSINYLVAEYEAKINLSGNIDVSK